MYCRAFSFRLFNNELCDEEKGEDVSQRVDFLEFSHGNVDNHIADHAPGNAVGYAVREGHADNGDKDRD